MIPAANCARRGRPAAPPERVECRADGHRGRRTKHVRREDKTDSASANASSAVPESPRDTWEIMIRAGRPTAAGVMKKPRRNEDEEPAPPIRAERAGSRCAESLSERARGVRAACRWCRCLHNRQAWPRCQWLHAGTHPNHHTGEVEDQVYGARQADRGAGDGDAPFRPLEVIHAKVRTEKLVPRTAAHEKRQRVAPRVTDELARDRDRIAARTANAVRPRRSRR